MESIIIATEKRFQAIDITEKVKAVIKNQKGNQVLIYTPHATAAIAINEGWDPNIGEDLLNTLNKIIPLHANYKHDKIDNNAAAHIKAAIIGPSEIVPIENGNLALGRWQNIFFLEFDGPRKERKIYVKVL